FVNRSARAEFDRCSARFRRENRKFAKWLTTEYAELHAEADAAVAALKAGGDTPENRARLLKAQDASLAALTEKTRYSCALGEEMKSAWRRVPAKTPAPAVAAPRAAAPRGRRPRSPRQARAPARPDDPELDPPGAAA